MYFTQQTSCLPYSLLIPNTWYIGIYTVDTLLYSLRFTNCIILFLPLLSEKEEYKVEKILNKGKFREYLVQQKGYIAENNTWEPKENLGNARDSVEKFKKKYKEEIEQIKKEDHKESYRKELREKYIADMLYR